MSAAALPSNAMAVLSGQRVAIKPRGIRAQAVRCTVRCAADKGQAKQAVAGVAALAGSALSPNVAFAEELSKNLQTFVDVVDGAAKAGTDVFNAANDAAVAFAPYVDRAGKALTPVGETAVKLIEKNVAPVASDLINKGSQAAGSAVNSAVSGIDSALLQNGLNVSVEGAVKTVGTEAPKFATAAKPVVTDIFEFLAKSDPTTLAEYVLALYVVYLARGVIGGFFGRQIRGYAGDLTPPQALDMLMENKSAVLVDLRTPTEVAAKGLLDLNKKQAKQVVVCERTTLQAGQYGNTNEAEIQVTAVKVASLKSLKKGRPVILLDQQGKQAKRIAKELTSRGYSKVYAVEGGFLAWMNAQLMTKASFSAKADALFVSRPVIPSLPGSTKQRATVDVVIDNPTPRRQANPKGAIAPPIIVRSLPPGK